MNKIISYLVSASGYTSVVLDIFPIIGGIYHFCGVVIVVGYCWFYRLFEENIIQNEKS